MDVLTLMLVVEAIPAIANPASPASLLTSDRLGIVVSYDQNGGLDIFERGRI